MSHINAAITGVAGYAPPYILTNQELEQMVETSDEWITTRTGIKERRILKGEGKGTSILGSEAVKSLLEKKEVDPMEVDGIICATISPDMMFPSTSNLISHAVGAKNAFSFDMMAACTGFIYALETGVNFIKSGKHKKIVVVGADKMSSITNYKDRNSCILFGDAAAAVLLEPTDTEYGVRDTILGSDGSGKDLIYLKAGGSAYPSSHETIDKGEHYFYQDGKSVFKYAVTQMADVAVEIMKKNHLDGDDVAYLIPHQANKRIIEGVAKRMGVSMDKVTLNIDRYGNTTAATIPLCLWEWEDQFKKGDNLILAAFGGGFTWGASFLKWAY
ncbi:MAG: beta-ketoacyl-ACP synthase III [Candidatus Cyclobacteriaceae bacterium M3_2C_046]